MFPGILDTLDDVELAKELFLTHGMPTKVIRPDELIAQIRQNRAQKEEQMFQAELAEKEAKAARNLGSEVEKESILDKAMGTV